MTTKRVLIADDDRDLADLLAIRITGMGLKVQTVHDALATTYALQNETLDLLILDVRMPAGNGFAVCETMARDPELSQIPVLVATGLKDPATVSHCHAVGAHYVFKAPDLWQRIEPLIVRQLGISATGAAAGSTSVPPAQERGTNQCAAQAAI